MASSASSSTPALLKFHLQSGPEIDLDQQQIESVKLSGEQPEPKFASAAMLREGGWLTAQDVRMKDGRVTLTMELEAASSCPA